MKRHPHLLLIGFTLSFSLATACSDDNALFDVGGDSGLDLSDGGVDAAETDMTANDAAPGDLPDDGAADADGGAVGDANAEEEVVAPPDRDEDGVPDEQELLDDAERLNDEAIMNGIRQRRTVITRHPGAVRLEATLSHQDRVPKATTPWEP